MSTTAGHMRFPSALLHSESSSPLASSFHGQSSRSFALGMSWKTHEQKASVESHAPCCHSWRKGSAARMARPRHTTDFSCILNLSCGWLERFVDLQQRPRWDLDARLARTFDAERERNGPAFPLPLPFSIPSLSKERPAALAKLSRETSGQKKPSMLQVNTSSST